MPELVLPLGETTRIELSATDVDHGFWIPDFLFKRDAIPGQTTVFDLSPTKLGTFEGRCSAFCGLQHESMLFRVRVVTPSAFVALGESADVSAVAVPAMPEAAERHDLLSWLTTTDHKRIGILYLLTSLAYFGVSGILSLLIRTQLARPNNTFVNAHQYAQLFTLHGTAMIFLFVAPFAFGLGKFLDSAADRCGGHGLSAAQRDVVLAVPVRRSRDLLGSRDERRRGRFGLDGVSSPIGDSREHGSRARSLDRRRVSRVGRNDRHVDQLRDDRLYLPRTRHDDVAHPDLHLGDGRDVAARVHGVPVAGGDVAAALRRPPAWAATPSIRHTAEAPCFGITCFGSSGTQKST
jgi:hypothetical protein